MGVTHFAIWSVLFVGISDAIFFLDVLHVFVGRKDKWKGDRKDGRMGGRMEGRTVGRTVRRMEDGRTHGRTDARADGLTRGRTGPTCLVVAAISQLLDCGFLREY